MKVLKHLKNNKEIVDQEQVLLQTDQKEHFQDQIIEIEILIRGNKITPHYIL